MNSHIRAVADGYAAGRLPRDRAGVLRPRAARLRDGLPARRHRGGPRDDRQARLGEHAGRPRRRPDGRGRGRPGRCRRLLLGRHRRVAGRDTRRRRRAPGVHDRVLRRRHPELRRRGAELPGAAALRREGHDPRRRKWAARSRPAIRRPRCTSYAARPRVQLRPTGRRTTRPSATLARARSLAFLAAHVG